MILARLSVRNPVAVNLLMLAIILSGLYYWFDLVREFFPNAEAEQVFITVPYPGATPEEVEKSVTRRIEREIENLEDIETIESKILEAGSRSWNEGAGSQKLVSTLEHDTAVNERQRQVEARVRALQGEYDPIPLGSDIRLFGELLHALQRGDDMMGLHLGDG